MMMKWMYDGRKLLSLGAAQLVALLALGCSAVEPDEPGSEAERSLELALQALNEDDLVLIYDERTQTVGVELEPSRFAEHAQGLVVELQVDVTLPDESTRDLQLDWMGEAEEQGAPHAEIPMVDFGAYEVVLSSIAINGRVLSKAPSVRKRMTLLGNDVSQGSLVATACAAGLLINGTNVADWIGGTPGQDSINGYAGSDTIVSGDCGDTIHADEDNDAVYGGNSSDVIHGDDGNDALWGESGGDFIYGDAGDDDLWGGDGGDKLYGGPGIDVCQGGSDSDTFYDCETVNQ